MRRQGPAPLRDDGPLAVGRSGGTSSAPVKAGLTLTWGDVLVVNQGKKPVILERVEANTEHFGGDLVGSPMIAGEDRPISVSLGDGGLPDPLYEGTARPLKGARVDPYRRGFAGTQILLGVRSPGQGR